MPDYENYDRKKMDENIKNFDIDAHFNIGDNNQKIEKDLKKLNLIQQ